jgi:ABC-type Fe3+-citrate transport system substrate-binding protein
MEKAIERLTDFVNDPIAKAKVEKLLSDKEELEKELDQHANVLSELTTEHDALEKELEEILLLETQESQIPPDEHTIKLQICQSLGIDMLQNNSGLYTRARIRKSSYL